MIPEFETLAPPDIGPIIHWMARLRAQEGVNAAREASLLLCRRYPANESLRELAQWHEADWWRPLSFGSIRLERRSPEHFDFVWSLVMDHEFSHKLKNIPADLTPRDLLEMLTQDHLAILPEIRGSQLVVFHGEQPIGFSMLVNINSRNRST